MRKYAYLAAVVLLLSSLGGSYLLGRSAGAGEVQKRWDQARLEQSEADRKETQDALDESRSLAREAEQRSQEALERAVRASEERQAARVAQAVRQAALEAATREGVYVAPECRLDDQTFEQLQEQLK